MTAEQMKIKSAQELGVSFTTFDIHNKEFSRRFTGYDEDQVNEFLDQVIKDYEVFGKLIQDFQFQIQQLLKEAPHVQGNLEGILKRLQEVEIYCWGRPKG